MEKATVRLRLNKFGSDVPLSDVTPAEAMFLHLIHQTNNGGSSFGDEMDKIKVEGEAQTVTGYTDEQVIPAVEAVAAKAAVGTPVQPGFQPAVLAVAAKPQQVIPRKPIVRARTNSEELNRLKKKYGVLVDKKGNSLIEKFWPGLNPTLPQKFSELKWAGLSYDGNQIASVDLASGQPVVEGGGK